MRVRAKKEKIEIIILNDNLNLQKNIKTLPEDGCLNAMR